MTGKTMGWILGLGLAIGGTLLSAAPAMADRDKDESRGRDRKEWREDRRDHDRHDRRDDRDDDKVSVKIGIGGSGHGHGHVHGGRRWVEGHYVTREERVLVEPGHYDERYIPAVYETRYDHCGEPYRVLVCPARHERVWCPPRYETRCVKVWVPGCWDGPVAYHPAPRRDSGFFFGFKGTFRD